MFDYCDGLELVYVLRLSFLELILQWSHVAVVMHQYFVVSVLIYIIAFQDM